MSEQTFERLFWLMPNVTSLSVDARIDLRRLLSTSRFSYRNLVKLHCDCTLGDQGIIELVKRNSSTLRELRIKRDVRDDLHSEATFAAIGSCSELRLLFLTGAHRFGDLQLEMLQIYAPHLACLKVGVWRHSITNAGLSRFMKRRIFRDQSSLSCLDPVGEAWRAAFRCLGEVPICASIEFESVYCHDGILCQIASSERLRALQLSIFCGITQQIRVNQRLRFFHGTGFRALTVERYAPSCAKLATIFLYLECENLTNETLAGIALQHPKLEGLFLNRCDLITYAGVEALLRHESHPRRLYLSSCSELSNHVDLALRIASF